MVEFSRDPGVRLQVFVDAGLLSRIPTRFQLLQGQVEMAPYVVTPDEGDAERYGGAPLGHPLLRTPIVFTEVGFDHFRVGHGLHARPESVYRHLMFVYHEGMPTFDLQLAQSIPGGLEALRRYAQEIEDGATAQRRWQRTRIDWIIPNAAAYRRQFLEPGGWIDRAVAFDYPSTDDIAAFLRPEFMSLSGFAQYCADTFAPSPSDIGIPNVPGHLYALARRCHDGYVAPTA